MNKNERPWYRKSFFRNLVDTHINNGDVSLLASCDPAAYARNMITAGVDTAYIYASNCLGLCLFPSKIGYRHQITEKRDLFGENLAACRAEGLGVVGYLNSWSTEAYNLNPGWRVIGVNNKGSRDGDADRSWPSEGHETRFGVCCVNSPYRDYFFQLVRELCSGYKIDGLWIDMVGFWRSACYCESCKKLYREETGREIPRVVNWESREWVDYIHFKQRSVTRYARDIRSIAQEVSPGISVSLQSAGWRVGIRVGLETAYFVESDYLSGDFYGDLNAQAVDCKFLRGVTSNQPFEYMTSRCPNLYFHTMSKPISRLRQESYEAILHGGSFMFIDAIDPQGTMNPELYRTIRPIRDELASIVSKDFYEGKFLSDTAVYINFASMPNPEDNGKSPDEMSDSYPLVRRLENIAAILRKSHIQFDIITDLRLDRLGDYPVIILPGVRVLSKKETKAFEAYVRNGGRLYVSGFTGIVDEPEAENPTGSGSLLRDEFVLSELMGVSWCGLIDRSTVYIAGKERGRLFSEEKIAYPYAADGPVPKLALKAGCKALAMFTLPISSHNDGNTFVNAISDPPWERTEYPALTENTYGVGRCVYSASHIEDVSADETERFLINIMEYLLEGVGKIRIEAPECVELSVKKAEKEIRIALFNTCFPATRAPVSAISIKIASLDSTPSIEEGKPAAVHIKTGGAQEQPIRVDTVRSSTGLSVKVDNLYEFAYLVIK
jgi:hypothetical protein